MTATTCNHLFSFILFIAISLVLWIRISVEATHYISPDSKFYLLVAENIKEGKGLVAPSLKSYPFDQNADEVYFTEWTAGYPALIALISGLTGTSVFFASKSLNIISLVLIFFLLYRWVGSRAWFPFLYFCSYAMLEVFSYTWSEPVFLFFLLLLCYVINRNWINQGRWLFLQLAFILGAMFLLRYAGLIYFQAVGLLALMFIWRRKYNMAKQYIIALMLSSAVVCAYFYYNYMQTGHVMGAAAFSPTE